jgi:hypothetical protein
MSYEAYDNEYCCKCIFFFAALFFIFSFDFFLVGWVGVDLVTALYCVAVEKEEFRLIWYAIIYRMFFILIIDICKPCQL